MSSPIRSAAKSFIEFLNESVTPFHAVESCVSLLQKAEFNEVYECDAFNVVPGGKYFMKKNQSCIFAFAVGGHYEPGNGFSAIVAHTDSPCMRVKPVSKRTVDKFIQVGVSTYGGGIWRTWFDRDLSVAGQVVFRRDGAVYHKLVNVSRPVLNIPNLAIHLEDDRQNFKANTESHLLPIFGLTTTTTVDSKSAEEVKAGGDETIKNAFIINDHHEDFLRLIADSAGCAPADLIDMDLYLYDAQPAQLTGVREEFISGARLDNLVGVYTAISGLIDSVGHADAFANDTNIRFVACYDNEEVGSASAQGAESAITEWLLRRLASSPTDPTAFERAIAKSYLVSADQAHACHPNYAHKHEDKHRPVFEGGVVVKVNVNQRYATTAITHAVLKIVADRAGVPLQKVVMRNDSPCGSTVGPLLSKKLGLVTVDVGCAQFAMHSIRELGDASSIHHATILYSSFFNHLPDVLRIEKCQ